MSRRGQLALAVLLFLISFLVLLFAFTEKENITDVFEQPHRQLVSGESQVFTTGVRAEAQDEMFQRTYRWLYNGERWSLTLSFDPVQYDQYKSRTRNREYDLFASDPFDDALITDVARSLRELAKDARMTDTELPYLVASFVQSLPYTSDTVTTGFDEYPRFPYETLFDDGGDCEDTSILTAALLRELTYDAVLIELPDHMAVGVQCEDSVKGSSVSFQGTRYCYLETTGENWPIGQMPDQYKDQTPRIIPVRERPVLNVDFEAKYKYNAKDLYADVDITVKNLGSETAKNARALIALQTPETSKVWDQFETGPVEIPPEGSYVFHVEGLHAPTGEQFRFYAQAYGDDVVSDDAVSEWVTWQ